MPSDGRASRFGSLGFFAGIAWGAFGAGMASTGAIRPLYAVAGFIPLAIAIAVGVRFPNSGVFARPRYRAVTGRRELALTFDDGPDPRYTPALLDLLEAHNQRATFFVIGNRAERHPELLREIVRRGHELANHTWTHSYLTPFMSPDSLAAELSRTNAVIENTTGQRVRWFRPPVGLLSPRVVRGAELAQVEIICWSATARDGTDRTPVNESVARLEPELTTGAILVMHDARMNQRSAPTATQIVTPLLSRMEALGLRSVTLSELFATQ